MIWEESPFLFTHNYIYYLILIVDVETVQIPLQLTWTPNILFNA